MKFTSSHIIQTVLFIPLAILTSCRDVPNDMLPELLLLDALNPPAYSLGGPVAELYGSETILTNRVSPAQISFKKGRSENLPLEAGAGEYTFKSPIYTGESYEVSVTDHPRSPTQFCSLENASGKIDNKSRDNVSTFCEGAYRVTTNLTGLKGSGLVLTSTAGDTIEVEADGAIEMPTPFVLSASYEVTVDTNPTKPWQTCRFTGEKATVTGANESENDLTIDALTCVTNEYPITANISGLVNSGLYLTLNGTDVEVPAGSTSYVLGNVVSGVDYTVTLASNAVGQECSVFGGKGSITDKGQSIEVSCTQNGYMVGGGLDNYNGSGLTVKLSGSHSETKEIDAGRTGYYFNTTFNHNDTYSIAITAQPTSPWQTCSITQNGSGKILASTGSMADADISCTTNQYGLSGSISGLSFSGLVLDVNGTEFPVSASATSADFGDWDSGTEYTVTVTTQPSFQTCTVANGTGTIGGTPIADISVSCVNNPFPVGGKVSGLVGSDTVTIKNNNGSPITLSKGTHTYYEITYADTYSITAAPTVHATGYSGCVVSNGTGTVGGPITNVNIVCTPVAKTLTLTVTDPSSFLSSESPMGYTVKKGAAPGTPVKTGTLPTDVGSLTETAEIPYGSSYTVTLAQPVYGTCSVASGSSLSGVMPATGTTINLTCNQTKAAVNLTVSGLAGGESISFSDGGTATLSEIATTHSGEPDDSDFTVSSTEDINDTYAVQITAEPEGKVCAFIEKQFGSITTSGVELNVHCEAGVMVGGRFQTIPAAPLNYKLYGGKVRNLTTLGGGSVAKGMAVNGGYLYYVDFVSGTSSIQRCNLPDCSSVTTIVSATGRAFRHLVTDGTNLYVANFASGENAIIYKYSATEGDPTTPPLAAYVLNTGSGIPPSGLALDQKRQILYAGLRGKNEIRRIHLDTGVTSDSLSTADTANEGMALLGDDLYIAEADTSSCILRATSAHDTAGPATLFAGSCGDSGFQDGPIASARFNSIHDITTDGTDLYVGEFGGNRIRRIDMKHGIVSTIAGSGDSDVNDGTGIQAKFSQLFALVTDGRSFYASSANSPQIRKITDNGLVGYWPLNASPTANGKIYDYASDLNLEPPSSQIPENASPTDGGTVSLSTLDRYGISGAAMTFTGTNSLKAEANNLPTSSDPRSLCAWFRAKDLPGSGEWYTVASYGTADDDGFAFGLSFHEDSGSIKAKLHLRGIDLDAPSAPIVAGKWTHMCGIYDGKVAKLYLNGKLLAQGDRTLATASGALYIGEWVGGDKNFKGSIADVRIYDRPLNEGEINELAQDADPAQVGAGYNTGATGLLSHYRFDYDGSAASLADGGSLGYVLTNEGDATNVTGKDGDDKGAYTYNGSDQYLNAASPIGLPLGSHPRTLCTWVKPSAYPSSGSWRVILSYGNKNITYKTSSIGVHTISGENFVEFMGWGDNLSIKHTLPLNSWSHICGTYDEGRIATLYVNGKEIGSQSKPNWNTTNEHGLQIGRQTSGAEYFFGAIDDVRIYNNALSSDQIRQLAVQVPAGLVAAYDFTKGDGSNPLFDISGWGNMLTEINGPDIGIGRFGSPDTAYSFDGSTQYLKTATLPISLPTGGNSRTMCAWVRDTKGDANDTVLAYGSSEVGKISGLYMNEQEPGLHGNEADLPAGYVANLNVWNHICGIYNESPTAGKSMVYVNGALTAQGTPPEGWDTPYNTDLYIGNLVSADSWHFHGDIDDVAIWNRALTPEEIQALVRQPNKTIGVTTGAFRGNMEKCMNPPTCSNWVSLGEVGTLEADWRCEEEFGFGFKAMLVDGTDRRACTSANCDGSDGGSPALSGIQQHIDWVLRPGITYVRSDGKTPIFTADWNGVWDFGTLYTMDGTSQFEWSESISEVDDYAWTGLNGNWTTASHCSNWASTGGQGYYGDIDIAFYSAISFDDQYCDTATPLYCVEQ